MSEFFSKIGSVFTTLSLIFSYIFGFGAVSTSNGYECVSTDKFLLADALCMGQGLCFDGEYYYSSGAITAVNFNCLAKYDENLHRKAAKTGRIPKELYEKYGSNHIGGIDCANGYIYAPVEDDDYKHNFILLFDCETLDFTGKYYELTCDRLTDGIPWCAVDAENGYLYTSQFDNVNEILRYHIDDMSFDCAVPISQTLNRLQGGSVYDGKLYLSYDVSHSTNEQVYSVDLSNGNVELVMERFLPNYDNEAEDILVYPFRDGTFIHTLDYDKLVGVNIRHYK